MRRCRNVLETVESSVRCFHCINSGIGELIRAVCQGFVDQIQLSVRCRALAKYSNRAMSSYARLLNRSPEGLL